MLISSSALVTIVLLSKCNSNWGWTLINCLFIELMIAFDIRYVLFEKNVPPNCLILSPNSIPWIFVPCTCKARISGRIDYVFLFFVIIFFLIWFTRFRWSKKLPLLVLSIEMGWLAACLGLMFNYWYLNFQETLSVLFIKPSWLQAVVWFMFDRIKWSSHSLFLSIEKLFSCCRNSNGRELCKVHQILFI